jgi:hypothetical protein
MQFRFYPLRFEFVTRESLWFPPGKAGNTLRGALGVISKRIACRPECRDVQTCESRASCLYARVFEPVAEGSGPSGLTYWPRPFVFRARHLDGKRFVPGSAFWFDVDVFSLVPAVLSYFARTFAEVGREGIGPHRAKAELVTVRRIGVGDQSEQVMVEGEALEPVALNLAGPGVPVRKIRVEFVSPTELKHDHRIAERPEFPILFGRVRDRISTLRTLYGVGPLSIDFRGLGERAAGVVMTRCEVQREEADRVSTRTGQRHSIGGFVGFAEYEGELGEFVPYLEAARWVGVGRQAVWGKGEIAVRSSEC